MKLKLPGNALKGGELNQETKYIDNQETEKKHWVMKMPRLKFQNQGILNWEKNLVVFILYILFLFFNEE